MACYSILVADDDKVSRMVMQMVLSNDKTDVYLVHEAGNAREAIKITDTENIDLVLLDWQMPDMSGLEAMKLIKAKHRTIPVIIVTAMVRSSDVSEALNAGANDYIKKPIDKVEFRARIRSALTLRDYMLEVESKNERIQNQMQTLDNLSLVVRHTEDSVIMFSPDGEMEWANDGFHKMYGYTCEEYAEIFGSNISVSSANHDINLHLAKMLEEQKTVNYVSQCQMRDGKTKWIQTALTPIYEGNRLEKIVAVESDITMEKESTLQLQAQNDELRRLTDDLRRANKTIDIERQKTRDLLLNIMPEEMVDELVDIGYAGPRSYRAATVMFTDFKGFTKACENLGPEQIVDALDFFFSAFDDFVEEHIIEKIKTIGDAYMCVSGIPIRNRTHPIDMVLVALKIKHFMAHYKEKFPDKKLPDWQLRIGIHTGPIVAGMVGKTKLAYDTWGDSVNVANRMESAGEVGKINISSSTYGYVKDYFECVPRGSIAIKNHQNIDMYFLERLKPEYSQDSEGFFPNKEFQEILNNM
ncbi:MAG: response regulator [Bacteroidales bacterium]|nr:response regulator [Bacteroidales bacterium]